MENNIGKPNSQEVKQEDLSINKSDGTNKFLTKNQGVKVNDDNNSLKAGERGPYDFLQLFSFFPNQNSTS